MTPKGIVSKVSSAVAGSVYGRQFGKEALALRDFCEVNAR